MPREWSVCLTAHHVSAAFVCLIFTSSLQRPIQPTHVWRTDVYEAATQVKIKLQKNVMVELPGNPVFASLFNPQPVNPSDEAAALLKLPAGSCLGLFLALLFVS
jgi:hypothetical protein